MIEIPVYKSDTRFPKTYRENLEARRNILAKCKEDLTYRAKVKELFYRDILFAFNMFFFTYDPRKRPQHDQPFCTWGFQDEAVLDLKHAVETGEDRLYEKSRDMGASWIIVGTHMWFWLQPIGGHDFLWGSRIEDYVDKKGDMRALFPKGRYILYKLPRWLRPSGFKPRLHDNYMKMVNPETGSTISGESSNPNFSTGGRYASILYDEFAKWEHDEAAWTAGGDATRSRIANSTPFGGGGKFFSLVTEGKTKRTIFWWPIHPEKSIGLNCEWPAPNEDQKQLLGDNWKPEEKIRSPWYDKECERRSAQEIAQELDINYLGSGNPIFDGPAWDRLAALRLLDLRPVSYGLIRYGDNSTGAKPYMVELEKVFDEEGYVKIYEKFDPRFTYVLGVDVVEGVDGGDYAIVTGLCRETKNVVLSYYSRTDEVLLAHVVYGIAFYLTPNGSEDCPWTGVETPGPGIATFDLLEQMGLPNLFVSPRYDSVKSGVSYKKGWRNDATSRAELIASVRKWLVYKQGVCHGRLVQECMTFVRGPTGKAQARSGCHDDEVFGFGIALEVDNLAPYERRQLEKVNRRTDGLPDNLFDLSVHKLKESEPSVEERCLAQALANRDPKMAEREFYTYLYGDD